MSCLFKSCSYGKVKGDYQYCEKCGKSRTVKCKHEWKIIAEREIYNWGNFTGDAYILQCKKCGETKQNIHKPQIY